MKRAQLLCTAFAIGIATGCASMGMNSVEKLNQLSAGMPSDEVEEILGEPSSSQMAGDKWVLKYTLHENWKGFVPYYFVFDNETRTLETWYEDEEEYQRNQAQMGETFKPLLEGQEQGGAVAPAGPNDPDLQRWITGTYYYFSSSMVVSAASERSLVLCADGRFRTTGEFSASGAESTWGVASQGGNTGRWTISGNRQSGTITLSFGGGTTQSVSYQVDSQAEQTMLFNQTKFAYAGVANCQ
jgi:hypothetical protein